MTNKRTYLFFICTFSFAILIAVGYKVKTDKISFLTITNTYPKQSYVNFSEGELLAGKKVTGEFISNENNMGIVAVRFLTYRQINNDHFIFRIKEKNNKNWYYENEYKIKEFSGYSHFPFGFPIVHNSKGKEYYFELESLYGRTGRAVGVSREEPAILVRHKFTINQLLDNKKALVLFLLKKSNEFLRDGQVIILFLQIFIILSSPFFLIRVVRKIAFPKISPPSRRVSVSIKKLHNLSQAEARLIFRFLPSISVFVRSIKIIGINIFNLAFSKLSYIHKWLGEE